jgi:biopolymer transport protein ExbD
MRVPGSFMGIRKPRIEMLPLIDIVFLLLVFFIYAMLSMAVHHSMELSLPVSATAEIDKELHLAISVHQDGTIFLDDRKIIPAELEKLLRDRTAEAGADRPVQVDLFADKSLSYQGLYRILDIIRSAGIGNVSLQAGTAE